MDSTTVGSRLGVTLGLMEGTAEWTKVGVPLGVELRDNDGVVLGLLLVLALGTALQGKGRERETLPSPWANLIGASSYAYEDSRDREMAFTHSSVAGTPINSNPFDSP